jgi:DNA-binding response OmpR family regulator
MSTLLIVEDEPNIGQFIMVNLRARGFAVQYVPNAEDGLALLQTFKPEAFILDIKLPGISGWEMLKVIDNDPVLPKIPVIIMTASSVFSQPDEYGYSNIVEKLIKPVSVTELLRAIRIIFPIQ